MPKMTIYIPDELKGEMDLQEPADPNWSAVAQEAFRLEVQRLKNRKEGASKMDAVVERLRVSKEKVENREKVQGNADGRQWAMDTAEYDELQRAMEFYSLPEHMNGYPYDDGELPSLFVRFVLKLDRDEFGPSESEQFWGGTAISDSYAEAFIDGATDVFTEVNNRMQ